MVKRCLALMILLGGISFLVAQSQLEWMMVVESVNDMGVFMRLDVHNPTTQEWNYSFPSSTIALYSMDGQYYQEGDLPVITPYTLAAGASDSFPMQHPYPLSEGTHVLQGHLNIPVSPDGYLAVGEPVTVLYPPQISILVGDGSLRSRIPIDFYWRSTLYECIYTATELNHQPGSITAISFFNDFSTVDSQPFLAQNIQVWLGHTFQTGLSAGWIPAGDLTPVFDGLVNFPVGHNEVMIPLSAPFAYVGNQNLVMLITRPLHSSYQFSSDPFEAQECDQERSLKRFTDVGSIDPYNPPAAQPSNYIPQMPTTRFHMIPNGDPVPNNDPHQVPSAFVAIASPNPFRDICVIVPKQPTQSTMRVYNTRGQLIRELHPTPDASFIWDGRDPAGNRCPAGVYLYRLNSTRQDCAGKLLLAH